MRYRAVLYSVLIGVFIASLILSFTSVGAPYSDNKAAPRLQRFRVIHTKRTFYDNAGSQVFSEVGYLLSTIDRNALRTLETSFGKENLHDWTEDQMCATETNCGFPLYRFNRGRYIKNFALAPSVQPARFTLLQASRDPNNPKRVIVNFNLDISTLTILYITPGDGWNFVNSTLATSERLWNEKPYRYSKITFGKRTGEIMSETIIFEVSFHILRVK